SFDTGDITGTDFRITVDGTQAIIIARQADDTYDIYLGDTTTGTHTLISTGTPLDNPTNPDLPQAGFVPGTTIALIRDGSTITTISTTDATILNHSPSDYDFTTPWRLTPDGQFAYTNSEVGGTGGAWTSIEVLNLATGSLSSIDVPDASSSIDVPDWWRGAGGVVDAIRSRAFVYTSTDGVTTLVTRYDFGDPANPTSSEIDGTLPTPFPYELIGYSPFDADGNFYFTTFSWTTVEGSPDPVAGNAKIHVIDPQLTEIDTIVVATGNKAVFAVTFVDGTLYAATSDFTGRSTTDMYRVSADGSATYLVRGFGWGTNDPHRMFILDNNVPDEPQSYSVFELTSDTQSTPVVVPANLTSSYVFDGKYLVLSTITGDDTLIQILDVNGNVTTVTIPDASIAQFDYTD
ncbi:MAG: hypothetical protein KC435_14850, partial [Thermomicrobiales bacterium]|nr:hypothetical protein [Thermomicrobiales bacterium]